jgi:prepilin-type N-terminal cleavage/methylation domain-containing protein
MADRKGLTLIELIVALATSAILIAGFYRFFIRQQQTYAVQEQVMNMRQNVRGGINSMLRELRMTGFGGVSMILPVRLTIGGSVVTYPNVINRDTPSQGWVTVITGLLTPDSQAARITADGSPTLLTVSNSADFDLGNRKYISVGGIESNIITNVNGNQLTLQNSLIYDPPVGTRVYPVRAVSYGITQGTTNLDRNDNTGTGVQHLAENTVESLQYQYLDAQGNQTASDALVQFINVTILARTENPDPQYQGGNGYRKREISSNIQLRNVVISP